MLRHDLFDVDRLMGETLAWLLTTLVSAGVFAAVVFGLGAAVGASGAVGGGGAAFAVALLVLPLHRRVQAAVGRVVDRERYVHAARIQQFVRDVRDGTAAPEDVETVLRDTLDDPGLTLWLKLPGSTADGYVDPSGTAVAAPPDGGRIPLRSGPAEVGLVVLGRTSARRQRRARELVALAALPIEVSRLRLELRAALEDARTSRARLVQAATEERRRLERDLHDGAQQQIVAAGMRLRSVQRRLESGSPEHRELDAAVEALEASIAELRSLAHGLRPSRLDDGLPAALASLVADSPVPVRLSVADVPLPEVLATTLYFVVAEAYANALKHAAAGELTVEVAHTGDALTVLVADDGVGGAHGPMTSVRDRVTSVGGEFAIESPDGVGTTVKAVIPHADRGGR
ncbi:sensor histidine kinase [Yinghuangia seranimata]|uniref:sensor histidine kinase n=1 Tax=Yinghuangia seranimata TaxID=408067 RepID=UPI00248A97C5|nr:histidine kinase [Yinghuangia seranimata]MDI2125485.1 histidine kinase [Yinghuangia seranimata]